MPLRTGYSPRPDARTVDRVGIEIAGMQVPMPVRMTTAVLVLIHAPILAYCKARLVFLFVVLVAAVLDGAGHGEAEARERDTVFREEGGHFGERDRAVLRCRKRLDLGLCVFLLDQPLFRLHSSEESILTKSR